LDGDVEFVYGYSFILTNLPVTAPDSPDGGVDPEALAEVEHWYRHRTDIEALNKDGKHGAALRHMPSAGPDINQVWMWAALLVCAMLVLPASAGYRGGPLPSRHGRRGPGTSSCRR
jgi:hypothetical protein